jgi:hypothetical protein
MLKKTKDITEKAIRGKLTPIQYAFLFIAFAAIVAGSFFFIKIFVLIFLVVTAAIIVFVLGLTHSQIDFDPVFSFSLLITHFYGLQYAVGFILLVDVIPLLIAGNMVEEYDLLFIGIMIFLNYLITFFAASSIFVVGTAAIIALHTIGFVMLTFLRNAGFAAFKSISEALIYITYLMTVGRIVVALLA